MDDIFTVLKARLGSISSKRTILELGAADGADSFSIAQAVMVGECEYFAFEPDRRNIPVLRRARIAEYPWFHVIDAAAGNFNGFVPFYECNGGHTFSSSVKEPRLHLNVYEAIKFEIKYQVRMVRLDDFFSVFPFDGCIDFIWCDIQGAEDLMIAGAQKTLSSTRFLYSECYETEMYEGQIGRREILKRLPGQWKISNEWSEDVLFENLSF